MDLYRIRLRPRSPWRTPWQADTLLGALCATAARTRGSAWLVREMIEPMQAGQPPFVLSDALPGEWLPIPALARLHPPDGTPGKKHKRLAWVQREAWLAWREGKDDGAFPWDACAAEHDLIASGERRHNTLSRENDASLEDGGLFSKEDLWLRRPEAATKGAPATSAVAPATDGCLTLYCRVRDAAAADLLVELLEELSWTGFGADVATGRGQFELIEGPQRDPVLEQGPEGADGVMVLSTFQPGPDDPTDGWWQSFPKFAKLGPDFGLENDQVRKRTMIMLRPGACFRCPLRPWLGWALPMEHVVEPGTAEALRASGVEVIHPAYGLAIPIGGGDDA